MKESARLKLLREGHDELAPVDEKEEAANASSVRAFREGSFGRKLRQAGIKTPPNMYALIVLGISTGSAYIGSMVGALLAIVTFVTVAHFLLFSYLDDKANKRKMKVIPQLAPFIDGLASALGAGFNIEGAIIQAAQGVPKGILRDELSRVASSLDRGFTVKESIAVLHERIAGKEITSLVVAVGLFSTVGGHVLEPFRRLAKKIREQQVVTEKAQRDLVLVRQAFKIILGLALGVPVLLIFVQPDYLNGAMQDKIGRIIIQMSGIMVIMALVLFKKITSIRM